MPSSLKNTLPSKSPDFPSKKPRFSVPFQQGSESFTLADPRATRALVAGMDMEAGMRGAASHWGGPSAFAEILSSLYGLVFHWIEKRKKEGEKLFHIINDAGHCENGIYALKANYEMSGLSLKDLKKFRSIESPLTGHGEAHLFPQGVYLSNGPLSSTLAQAQGLCMADKLLGNHRMTIACVSDGACMEGEAKEALNAIPGFSLKKKLNPFLLLISDNNTKLTGRIDEDSFSMEPFFKSLSVWGWDCSFVEKGNDLQSVFKALKEAMEKAERGEKPVALIFKTCKGFGVKKTMEEASGGHGFPLKNPEDLEGFIREIYGKEEPPKEMITWCEDIVSDFKKQSQKAPSSKKKAQPGISKAMIEQKEKGLPLVSISSDLFGSTGVADFRKKFPEHSFDVGVAESNMISVGAGFSKQGFIPVVDTFAQFAITKGSLPLIMSALSEAPVIGVFSHIGFQDAADGASHQALSYFAKTCSLPHTKVFSLSCFEEAYHLFSKALEQFQKTRKSGKVPKSQIFFLGRETFPESYGAGSYDLNTAQVLFDNTDKEKKEKPVLIVTSGPLVEEALLAGEELDQKGRGVIVINNPCVSDPDLECISKYLKISEGRLITVEEHQVKGGMSSLLILALKEKGVAISQFQALGVRGTFGRSAYKARDLYKLFGLDKEAILKAALKMN